VFVGYRELLLAALATVSILAVPFQLCLGPVVREEPLLAAAVAWFLVALASP